MFPLYSDRPLLRFPFVTILLICANVAVFWYQFTFPGSIGMSVLAWGMIPYDLLHEVTVDAPYRAPAAWTLFTSMFMHGGILHLGSNMLFLWVFGRNVEDDFGHVRFLVMYLATGVLSTTAFAAAYPDSTVPLVGASGAIAGVLGVYFLRFPASRIYCLVIFFIFIRIVALPAFFVLGLWFFIQIGSCMLEVTSPAGAAGRGGIAWISHIAGFIIGLVWTIFELRRRYYLRHDGW